MGKRFSLFWLCVLLVSGATGSAVGQNDAPTPPSDKTQSIITKEEAIESKAGDVRRLKTEAHIVEVAVTRPEVADAFLSGSRELSLLAHSPGFGKVLVRLDNGNTIAYKIRVHVADPEDFAAQLRERLGHIHGINIEVVKEKVLIDGRVLYLEEMDAIERAVGDNPSVINLTSLSSRNARILAREIERELRASGIYGADVEVRDNRVTLVGTLRSNVLARKAETIASKYTTTFDNLLEVSPSLQDSRPSP
ncbi:MAG: hypothetical protein Kow0099_03370 [Candidatus Abyssubacteria bacterium]